MGLCNSSSLKHSVTFVFDTENFCKKHVLRTIPSELPLSYIFSYLQKNLSPHDSDCAIILRVREKMYTQTSGNTLISDLRLSPSDRIHVAAKKLDSTKQSVHLRVFCCGERDEISDFNCPLTAESLTQAIIANKTCCNNSSCEIIVNELCLYGTDRIPASSSSKTVQVVFGDNKYISYKKYWKVKKPGLNLKGICFNPQCQFYKHDINIPRGLGYFSMKEEFIEIYMCPYCSSQLQMKSTTIFANCVVRYQTANGEVISRKVGTYPEDVKVTSMIEVTNILSN